MTASLSRPTSPLLAKVAAVEAGASTEDLTLASRPIMVPTLWQFMPVVSQVARPSSKYVQIPPRSQLRSASRAITAAATRAKSSCSWAFGLGCT